MNSKSININEVAKELGLYVKVVTSTKSFDNYNSFFNIYSESEEPCRRIVVLTPYDQLEEVYDENSELEIKEPVVVEDNLWIKDFPLTMNPNKINLKDMKISIKSYEKLKKKLRGEVR